MTVSKKLNWARASTSAVTLLLAMGGVSMVANAQDDTSEADDRRLDTVQVTGVRASVERALDIKKNATGFVDAISAEDVGKLPDQNVAEALQRVTGVAIQRSRGEGDFVSIRGLGPDFVRGTLNGRTLLSATETVDPNFNGNLITSTGRGVNFDILPAEVISTLEVVKSSSARDLEGGIGGSVNVVTARPLDLGTRFAGSITGNYREFNEDTDPAFSGLYSWNNEDKSFGLLGAVSYSERSIREDFSRTFGWFPSFGISSQLDTNNDGVGDASPNDVPFPLSDNAEVYEEDRERLTFVGTAQWRSDDMEVVVDALYSERTVNERHQNLIFLPIIFDGDLAGQTVNPDGSVQVGNFVTDGTFTVFPTSLRPELTTDLQDYEDELLSLGVNATKQIGSWEITGDLSYSKATGESAFDRVRIDGDRGTFSFLSTIDQNGYTHEQLNLGAGASADLGNPDNFVISVFDDRFAQNEDEEFAADIKAELDIESEFVSSIEFGANYTVREKTIDRASNGNGIPVVGAGVSVSDVGSFARGGSNFLDGSWRSNFDYSNLIFPVNADARSNPAIVAFLNASGASTDISFDPFGSFSVQEDTFSSYAQINLDGQFGGVNFIGDFGLRILSTTQTVDGSDAEFVVQDNGGQDTTIFDTFTTGAATPVSFDFDYADVLPSANLRFELVEDFYLRFAANQTITRPTFNSLAPGLAVNANGSDNGGDNFAIAASAGNPNLEPIEATNFDLGYEWYFGQGSAIYAGLFYKDIENFVATVTNNDVTELAGQPIRAFGIEQDGTRRPIEVDILTQPENQGSAQVSGVEIGIQQTFDSGFGYIANVTLTDTSAELESTGETIAFPGVSETSFNATGFYERGPLQARLAYSWRDEFLVEPSAIGFGGQLFNDSYGQLEGSISYDVNENFTVFLNAVNLTDEDQDVFQILPAGQKRFFSTSHVGRRFGFGVRGSF